MRNLIKKSIKSVFALAQQMILNYRYYSFRAARIFLKSHDCPGLTREEKKEIDDWWAGFGIRFPNYDYHTMYYRVTGIRDPRFIPEPLMSIAVTPHYNDKTRVVAYTDKSKFSVFMPQMPFPQTLAYRMDRHYYGAAGEYMGETVSEEFVSCIFDSIRQTGRNSIIIKQSTDTFCGLGVKKYSIESQEQLKNILEESKSSDYVIQFAVKQHPFFEQFNPDSVNIIRINSWRHGSEVEILAPAVRFGIKGSHTDVAFVNGKEIIHCVGIDDKGFVREKGVDLEGETIELELKDRKIPKWEEIKALVRENHLRMPFFDFIAWDITVDDKENVVCIEYNLRDPGSIVYQFANGPLAGDYSDMFLSFLKDAETRKSLLPGCIRKRNAG